MGLLLALFSYLRQKSAISTEIATTLTCKSATECRNWCNSILGVNESCETAFCAYKAPLKRSQHFTEHRSTFVESKC